MRAYYVGEVRYCSGCSAAIPPSVPYVVTPELVGEPTIECIGCASSPGPCRECGDVLDPDFSEAIHASCASRPSCNVCELPIDDDEAARHAGCNPSSTPNEETPK